MLCKEREILMYLKKDELSGEENDSLQNHIQKCEECRNKYIKISNYMQEAHFENFDMEISFLEERIVEGYKEHQNKKHQNKISTKRIIPIRRQLLKALSIASVFFFLIFSVEQLNTMRKIYGLEQKLANTKGTNYQPRGQVLVLNHFYKIDDLKQIINSDFDFQENRSPAFFGSGNMLSVKLFSNNDNLFLQKMLHTSPLGKAILNREFYGNSQLLNISFD